MRRFRIYTLVREYAPDNIISSDIVLSPIPNAPDFGEISTCRGYIASQKDLLKDKELTILEVIRPTEA